jgi:hypothetical protein
VAFVYLIHRIVGLFRLPHSQSLFKNFLVLSLSLRFEDISTLDDALFIVTLGKALAKLLKSLTLVVACEGNAKSKTFVHFITEASGKELIVVSGSKAHGDLSRTDSCSVESSFSPLIAL